MEDGISIYEIDQNDPRYLAMLALRKAVLREPLGLEYSAEDLAAESDQIHLILAMGPSEDDPVIGCALLVEGSNTVAKVRQVAVVESLRRKGLGRMLMLGVGFHASERGFTEIQLHSRETAVPFYKSLGYETLGDSFIEIGLPHILMRKRLS